MNHPNSGFKPSIFYFATAVAITAVLSDAVFAHGEANPLQIDVTGSQEGGQGILIPSKIVAGDELQNKLGNTLGATLANELGVSATGFGAGSSRPVIRGLDGPRVQVLQNGLSVGDVSSISPDHAVASPIQNARQIEILRGAAALMYGSGSSGGLVNVVNDRIHTNLPTEVSGAANTSYDTVSNGRAASGVIDAAVGNIALHLDTAINNNNNYRFPGNSALDGNTNWAIPGIQGVNYTGKLPYSFTNQNNLGLGASYIGAQAYTGVSVERMNHNYGIPTPEGGFIQQSQNRYDFQHQTRNPFDGFSSIKISVANSNYNHTEFASDGVAATIWKNVANEARIDLTHQELMGFKGNIGAQWSASSLNANDLNSGNFSIVPNTKSNSNALFLIEEGKWGALQTNFGLRYNQVSQSPNTNTDYQSPVFTGTTPTTPTAQFRNFNLFSSSLGGLWNFAHGYGTGLSYTVSQRAPSPQELYSYGIHESTATYDVGNSNLNKETSHNLEYTLQKTAGLLKAKANLYVNKFNNYIYAFYTGAYETQTGFSVTQAQQASATIKGAEGEITYNWNQTGTAARLFGDIVRGSFDAGGNLPLQPAPRVGAEIAHQKNGWLTSTTYIYGFQQNRLASWEVGPTPSYNLLNATLSYSEKINRVNWTAYALVKNILNQEIRYSTTPMAVRLYAPQPGRSFMVGLRGNF
ncbi:MAG: TonB-dependent receptor [Polynucleobacter sp.]|nr:TonB-dependent receptor [Polynucleobacter sp.]